jgi:hypothetical protein
VVTDRPRRPWLFLGLGLLAGLVVGGGAGLVAGAILARMDARRQAAATAAVLVGDSQPNSDDWMYPGAKPYFRSSSGGGSIGMLDLPYVHLFTEATEDDFDKVLEHYAAKLGGVGLSDGGSGSGGFNGGGSTTTFWGNARPAPDSRIDTHWFTVISHCGPTGTPRPVRSIVIGRRTIGYDLTVFIQRAKDERYTYISVFLFPRSLGVSP